MHCASLLHKIFASLACTNGRMHIHKMREFPQAKLDSDIGAHFLLNESSDLYFVFIISMRTVSSITGKKLAEIYGYFFGKWNKFYRGRHNRPNSACPNYVSFKRKKIKGIWRHFLWDVDEYTIKESQTLCDITHCIEK